MTKQLVRSLVKYGDTHLFSFLFMLWK
jgi:hypothetical protein